MTITVELNDGKLLTYRVRRGTLKENIHYDSSQPPELFRLTRTRSLSIESNDFDVEGPKGKWPDYDYLDTDNPAIA